MVHIQRQKPETWSDFACPTASAEVEEGHGWLYRILFKATQGSRSRDSILPPSLQHFSPSLSCFLYLVSRKSLESPSRGFWAGAPAASTAVSPLRVPGAMLSGSITMAWIYLKSQMLGLVTGLWWQCQFPVRKSTLILSIKAFLSHSPADGSCREVWALGMWQLNSGPEVTAPTSGHKEVGSNKRI
jgi:hypothetical protein